MKRDLSQERRLVLCVTTEASGDRILASLLPHLIRQAPHLEWAGIGGPRSTAAGLTSYVDPRTLAAHGLTEALGVLPATLRALRMMSALLPHAVALILVDSPELNMRLLKRARRFKLPVAYIAPPQAWAWRPWRAELLREASWLGCLFEFETQWFRSRGVNAHTIGHPLVLSEHELSEQASDEPLLDLPSKLLLAPGSRPSAIKRALPLMLKAACLIQEARPGLYQPTVTIAVSSWAREAVRRCLEESSELLSASRVQVALWEGLSPLKREVYKARWVAISHAGTATLELGLAGVPYVAIAPLSAFSAFVAKRLVQAQYISLPNLICSAFICPELGPRQCDPLLISDSLVNLGSPVNYLKVRRSLSSLKRDVRPLDYDHIVAHLIRIINSGSLRSS